MVFIFFPSLPSRGSFCPIPTSAGGQGPKNPGILHHLPPKKEERKPLSVLLKSYLTLFITVMANQSLLIGPAHSLSCTPQGQWDIIKIDLIYCSWSSPLLPFSLSSTLWEDEMEPRGFAPLLSGKASSPFLLGIQTSSESGAVCKEHKPPPMGLWQLLKLLLKPWDEAQVETHTRDSIKLLSSAYLNIFLFHLPRKQQSQSKDKKTMDFQAFLFMCQ